MCMLKYLQFMGTEMPCTDRSPSPTIPTSGEKTPLLELKQIMNSPATV